MTDEQFLNVILKRVSEKTVQSGMHDQHPKIVVFQQFGKHLYFGLTFNDMSYTPLMFRKDGVNSVFKIMHVPEHLESWRYAVTNMMKSSMHNCIDFDIAAFPKEIVHIFFSGIISALNTPGMSIRCSAPGLTLFEGDETYEQVCIEADMTMFENDI